MYRFITETPSNPQADVMRYFMASGIVGILPFVLLLVGWLSSWIPFAGFYIAIVVGLLAALAMIAIVPVQAVIFNQAFNSMRLRGRHRLAVTLSCVFFAIGPYALVIWIGGQTLW